MFSNKTECTHPKIGILLAVVVGEDANNGKNNKTECTHLKLGILLAVVVGEDANNGKKRSPPESFA